MEKRDFSWEHYEQLLKQNRKLAQENKWLHERMVEKDENIQEKDELIFAQNLYLDDADEKVSKLTETVKDNQSKGASILKASSDTLKGVEEVTSDVKIRIVPLDGTSCSPAISSPS
ncbi:hypothetical protein DFP93_101260 [Aneurinibacillus soli]|uniref:Uncharacterized protein n=1 Tax=Aneurinibacillus soli TaxID=1500254 RepID=A0A0U5BDA5_9BACL|nr:hypothetical protein [Aneurinibacillus soli]PYE64234.1 hypothetical protein DFP93_101260 [Aneurinibacillus soli]BAU28183.1 hypothetical protein CB4_02357 [Aneurinibacillus soli]